MAGHAIYASTHASSSAFSASANPNEDWTKISDLAERRRIQNRIAQRNYRKKLKRRLEDLERRAGSSPAPPEESHSGVAAASEETTQKDVASQFSRASTVHEVQLGSLEIPPLRDHFSLLNTPAACYFSTDPMPAFTCFNCPFTTACPRGGYQLPTFDYPGYPCPVDGGISGLSPTLTCGNQDLLFGGEGLLSLSMNYASLAGLETSSNHGHIAADYQTPPLTDSHSIESPNYADEPLTPLSGTESPGMRLFDVSHDRALVGELSGGYVGGLQAFE